MNTLQKIGLKYHFIMTMNDFTKILWMIEAAGFVS